MRAPGRRAAAVSVSTTLHRSVASTSTRRPAHGMAQRRRGLGRAEGTSRPPTSSTRPATRRSHSPVAQTSSTRSSPRTALRQRRSRRGVAAPQACEPACARGTPGAGRLRSVGAAPVRRAGRRLAASGRSSLASLRPGRCWRRSPVCWSSLVRSTSAVERRQVGAISEPTRSASSASVRVGSRRRCGGSPRSATRGRCGRGSSTRGGTRSSSAGRLLACARPVTTRRLRVPGLDRHIRTVDVEEHARLAFRRDCPRCRVRLAGPPPSGDVVPVRAKAALATAAVLASGALPVTSATAQDEGGDDSAEIAPPSGSGSESESGPPITPADERGRGGAGWRRRAEWLWRGRWLRAA